MTDDAGQYYNAWSFLFGQTEKKLCVWRIDRAWRKALRENVPDSEAQIEIYHMLRSVMQELDVDTFNQCVKLLTEHLQATVPRFAAYFAPYVTRATEWAFCHRRGTQANTNMYLESFHNVLKSCYMERKANRRADSLLQILLRVARDKAFERLIKVEKAVTAKN
jgi:hypothetical protein